MNPIAELQIVDVGSKHILAGHSLESESAVYVLRKDSGDKYSLLRWSVPQADQELRALAAAGEVEASERVKAILETMTKRERDQIARKVKNAK